MKKADPHYVPLPGSNKHLPQGNQQGAADTSQIAEVTIRIRRKASVDDALAKGLQFTHKQYEEQFGASDADIAKVEAFAHDHHLSIVESSKARRSVILRGTIANLQEAFQVHLGHYVDDKGCAFRGRSGNIHIPADLEGIIEGVFGLDDRPHARPMFQMLKDEGGFIRAHAASASFTPPQLAGLYGFPKGATGTGQAIGIIELGGGYRTADLNNYFKSLGLKTPAIKAVSVDGGANTPSTANSDDGEVMLDIEVAGAVAPGASIVVYFAKNTDQAFLDAITTAIHDTKNNISVISISWGAAEKAWTQQSLTSFDQAFQSAALLGVTITVAAGDQGSSDNVSDGKVHVDFPSSSPYVLACGGTSLHVSGSKITSETVWHVDKTSATGGGVSEKFPLPSYQAGAGVPVSISTGFKGRGVPDVAGDADPNTGYQILVDGQQAVFGGTSAVAPLMAGLIALCNQVNKNKAGFINPKLYANPAQFCRDIVTGDNKTTGSNQGYTAKKGWDACTGWGVMNKV